MFIGKVLTLSETSQAILADMLKDEEIPASPPPRDNFRLCKKKSINTERFELIDRLYDIDE